MSRLRFMPFLLMGAAWARQVPPPKPPVTTPPSQALPPDEDPAPAPKPAALPPDEDKPPAQTKPVVPPGADTDLPPDEDVTVKKEEFSFNPVKSKKAVEAGDFYFKKSNYKASAERFREATGWNEGNAEAWLKLGESEEKRGQIRAARSAYEKYLQLAANTKSAAEVKKRLEKLK